MFVPFITTDTQGKQEMQKSCQYYSFIKVSIMPANITIVCIVKDYTYVNLLLGDLNADE